MDTQTDIPDLSIFDGLQAVQDEGIDVPILGPDQKPLGFTIRVAGPDSERQRAAIQKMADERLESQDASLPTAADIEARQTRGLAMSVMSWTPFKFRGSVLPCNEPNAILLFQTYPFIRDQVAAKAGSRQAFFDASRRSAPPQ